MTEKTIKMCPKCGSINSIFPNPLKISESGVNFPGMANSINECVDCGYVGIFIEVDEKKVKEVRKEIKNNSETTHENSPYT